MYTWDGVFVFEYSIQVCSCSNTCLLTTKYLYSNTLEKYLYSLDSRPNNLESIIKNSSHHSLQVTNLHSCSCDTYDTGSLT